MRSCLYMSCSRVACPTDSLETNTFWCSYLPLILFPDLLPKASSTRDLGMRFLPAPHSSLLLICPCFYSDLPYHILHYYTPQRKAVLHSSTRDDDDKDWTCSVGHKVFARERWKGSGSLTKKYEGISVQPRWICYQKVHCTEYLTCCLSLYFLAS